MLAIRCHDPYDVCRYCDCAVTVTVTVMWLCCGCAVTDWCLRSDAMTHDPCSRCRYCDCGDPEAWVSDHSCSIHGADCEDSAGASATDRDAAIANLPAPLVARLQAVCGELMPIVCTVFSRLGKVPQLRRFYLGLFLARVFSPISSHARVLCCALLSARADWMLIGGCNPMLCRIHVFRLTQPSKTSRRSPHPGRTTPCCCTTTNRTPSTRSSNRSCPSLTYVVDSGSIFRCLVHPPPP